MLKLFAQIAFVVVVCVALFALVGFTFYATIGGLFALTAFALLLARGPWSAPDEETDGDMPAYAAEFFWRLVLSAALGVIWPSIPAIFYAKRPSDRDDRPDLPLKR